MTFNKITIDDVNVANKRVLCRVDYNVPIKGGEIKDDTRITATLPTIKKLVDAKSSAIILMSHLGRPNGKQNDALSLKPVATRLSELLKREVYFRDITTDTVKFVDSQVAQGNGPVIVLLENLRFHPEEEGKYGATKEGIASFRKLLSQFGDVYVNDAFGTAHRAHSSMVGMEDIKERCAGELLRLELKYFGQALSSPPRPFVAILGGAKVVDKIKLIMNLLPKIDEMIVVGGMAFTFAKVLDGTAIGNSLFDKDSVDLVKDIQAKAKELNVKLHFPVDYVCAAEFKDGVDTQTRSAKEGVPEGWMGLDIGPKSVEALCQVIERSKLILWNGPAGVFEFKSFCHGSEGLLKAVVKATQGGAVSIVGGGDTASLVTSRGKVEAISHVSTGGGASLELCEGKTLPGVTFLTNKA